jgi:hypothetical protein
MEVINYIEQPDGGAEVHLDMTEDEAELLINLGLKTLLKQAIIEAEEAALSELSPQESEPS